jgi:hypothetical protein
MNQLNNISNEFDKHVNGLLSGVSGNQYLSTALSIFLILYASLAAPKLPEGIAKLFDNVFFKGVICFLIAYMGNRNPTVAIISAVGLIVSLQTLQRYEINKQMVDVAKGAAEEAPGVLSQIVGAVDDELKGLSSDAQRLGQDAVNDVDDMIGADGKPKKSGVKTSIKKHDGELEGVAEVEELEEHAPVDGSHQGNYNAHAEVETAEGFRGSFDDQSLNYASYY